MHTQMLGFFFWRGKSTQLSINTGLDISTHHERGCAYTRWGIKQQPRARNSKNRSKASGRLPPPNSQAFICSANKVPKDSIAPKSVFVNSRTPCCWNRASPPLWTAYRPRTYTTRHAAFLRPGNAHRTDCPRFCGYIGNYRQAQKTAIK